MELLDVSKSYGDKKVLSSLTLHIKERATTVLRLEKADCGTIRTEGRVSALFQEDRLIDNLSIMNNLLLVSDDKARIKELLKESGLEGEEKNRVVTLSGGMKRRVALVRALLTDYDTLLLDEPFSGLDAESKRRISALIRKEVNGRTLVVITHDDDDYSLLDADERIVI